jgi:lysophospholipase L1-like esterase
MRLDKMARQLKLLFAVFLLGFALLYCLSVGAVAQPQDAAADKPLNRDRAEDKSALSWPKPTVENRPWTRWWWLGSAVDKENLTAQLTQFRQGGLGGVEICPIYGVKGYEDRHIEFLTPRWMQMLAHTTQEAKRLDLGVDLTTGTGWPFGGPGVTDETTSVAVSLTHYDLQGGGRLEETLPNMPMQYVAAVAGDGRRIDLTDKVRNRRLEWQAPQGQWRIYAVGLRNRVQRVKRAAPGGEGYVVDPYSTKALDQYLGVFDKAFEDFEGPMPRAQFHDSFEYYNATWTRDFFEVFKTLRGYELRDHIELLFGDGDKEMVARVKSDYRRTISDLHVAYIEHWTQWSHRYHSLSRNQAHGAPANLIDLYAAADIPETEIFRTVDQRQIPMLKFSSSAAHLAGKPYASSESFTWLGEHFQTSLAEIKAATDLLFLGGVNHLFFHGIPYSPQDAPWPGWQFYASVNMGPNGGLWRDMPAYTAYVTRCQSILQSGTPDNEVLLYWPVEDLWHNEEGLWMAMTIHNQDKWLWTSPFYQTAITLWGKGYPADYVSKRLLGKARWVEGAVVLGSGRYQVVIVPPCRVMSPETLEKLISLARDGATVLFVDAPPQDVPGLFDRDNRREQLHRVLRTLGDVGRQGGSVWQKDIGSGRVMVGELEKMLTASGLMRETGADKGLGIVRRSHPQGHHYFLVNLSNKPLDDWITLARPAYSAVLMDPMFEDRTGLAAVRHTSDGQTQVYLQMQPGQSLIVRTFADSAVTGPSWCYTQPADSSHTLNGTWRVEFIDGGPTLPQPFETTDLVSWTKRDDPHAECFAGTARYTLKFDRPDATADVWRLELGKVCHSAKVFINGSCLGTLICEPYAIDMDASRLQAGQNTLVVEVTNLAANRIRDLDRRGVNWKYFYDINIVNVDYKPFDASDWPLQDSGLLGPVKLVPLGALDPHTIIARKPTLYIIGDSTVRNVTTPGQWGWGEPLTEWFDDQRITVVNRALGGRSSRTFLTEGLWDAVLRDLKAGDFVLIQFGHNDGGSLYQGRARASLKGIGEQTEDVILEATGKPETVHTYGWYLRRYIRDAKAKGAIPIVLSLVPRNIWNEDQTQVIRAADSYGGWAEQVARQEGVYFIDLNDIVARRYEQVGPETVGSVYFGRDHTHTTPAGAAVTAKLLAEAIDKLQDCPLKQYLKPQNSGH